MVALAGPLLSGRLILYRVGVCVRGQKMVCGPIIDLQVRAPLIDFGDLSDHVLPYLSGVSGDVVTVYAY